MNDCRIIDLAPTANLILRELISLKKEEELLIVIDSETIMPMAYSLAFIASEIGSEYSISLMPNREKGHGRNPKLVNVLPKAISKAYEGADVIVGLTRGTFAPTTAKIILDVIHMKKKARYMSLAFRDLDNFLKGGCLADYHKIKDNCIRVKEVMENSSEIKIETKLGTNFRAEIPKIEDSPKYKGPYVRIEDGWVNKPGKEGAFPDGEAFFAPRQYSANGVLVVDGPIEFVGMPKEPIKVVIENGAIVKVEGKSYEAQKLRDILAIMEDSEIIGEIAVGLNYKSLKDGNVQEEKKALGSVHIGFGIGSIFPGTWTEKYKSIIHSDMVIRDAIVKLDDKIIIEDNKLSI